MLSLRCDTLPLRYVDGDSICTTLGSLFASSRPVSFCSREPSPPEGRRLLAADPRREGSALLVAELLLDILRTCQLAPSL